MPPVKLSVADNPPDPEEVYPGKFSRNNPVGSVKDREEFLLQKRKIQSTKIRTCQIRQKY